MAVSGRIKFLTMVISFRCADGAAPSRLILPAFSFAQRDVPLDSGLFPSR
jgi:hypothetical protein